MMGIHADDDVHLTLRLARKTQKRADEVVIKAIRDNLRVAGNSNPVRVRQSHVLKLAVELGMPLVLAELRTRQEALTSEE